MNYRTFGRTGWKVSEIGYGMWGLGGDWKGSSDAQAKKSLDLAIENGVNFFDSAFDYGKGHSEKILGELLKRHSDKKLYAASKLRPENGIYPPDKKVPFEEVYTYDYIMEATEQTLRNVGVEKIDLLQFHVWEDAWADKDEWKKAVEKLKKEGKIDAMGISINRWEPANSLETIRTGLIDSVQVIYNIFDQAPEDELLPLCEEMDIAVIARVPFDEGTLTGNITKETKFEEGDWRASYFVPENLNSSVEHADKLRPIVPEGMTMAEMALKFILRNKTISTTIPGMRKERNVLANTAVSNADHLPDELYNELKGHRWDREPTWWSQ